MKSSTMRQSKPPGKQIAAPHPRDILKREYNEALGRGPNPALEKWGPEIEAEILRDLEPAGLMRRS